MNTEKEKTVCYRHPNKETRLTCTECGKYICPSCAIQAPVGQKCPDCVASRTTHLEEITTKQYIIATSVGILVSFILTYVWNFITFGGIGFIGLILSYVLGYLVCISIKKAIGPKIGFKIQAIAGISVIIGMLYNPIQVLIDFNNSHYQISMLVGDLRAPFDMVLGLTSGDYSSVWLLLSIAIALWASVRHFKI